MIKWLPEYLEHFIITGIFGGIVAYLRQQAEKNQEERIAAKAQTEATQAGLRALLKINLIEFVHKAKTRGYLYFFERENMDSIYAEYRNLGGNGPIERLMAEIEDLETKTDLK